MKKIIFLLIVSTLFVSSCSYMPKWLTEWSTTEEGNKLETEQVKPEVVYYDTETQPEAVEEGVITNDLNAIFYEENEKTELDESKTGIPTGSLTQEDIVQIPSRENINPGNAAAIVPENDVVYFAFDSSSMSDEVKNKIKFHINFLKNNPEIRVVLEGHADERGSREYNLGLGELRALAVKDLMVLDGVKSSQVFVISYGEENPANPANNEQAWAENRRVEVIYR